MQLTNDNTIKKFLSNLHFEGKSKVSIKNYKSDISHFLAWATLKLKSFGTYVESLLEITPFIDQSFFADYKNYMVTNNIKVKTINRRLSTLRNLSRFLSADHIIDHDFMQGIQNVGIGNKPPVQIKDQDIVDRFKESLISTEKASANTVKNYLADVKSFLDWSKSSSLGLKSVTSEHVGKYRNEVLKSSSASTFDRKVFSLKKFFEWAAGEGVVDASPIEEFIKQEQESIKTKLGSIEKQKKLVSPSYTTLQARIVARFAGKPRAQKLVYNLFYSRPNWYKTYHTLPIATYFNYAILVLLMSALGYGVYNQFFKTTTNSLAYPSALTRAGRYLSFQGRLTTNFGNPITTATNVDFKLYNASTSGTLLWDSSTCSITPDTDGIFSTLLGNTCGSEIASSVFSENSSVWLGVTVGADAEATPRVQIATVAYALNSETLQGYPASESATANTVPVMNSAGQIVLAASSPKIQSTSGNFGIEGQTITITTPTSSNGNITLAPDGSGVVNLNFSGAAPGGSADGFVNATNANVSSGALYYGEVANGSSGYNLLQLASGSTPTDKFVVDSAGNVTIAGNITGATWTGGLISSLYGGTGANNSTAAQYAIPYYSATGVLGGTVAPSTAGYVLSTNNTGSAPTWIPMSAAGTNYWQLGNNILAPINVTNDLTIGGNATGSAFQVFGVELPAGNVQKITSSGITTGNLLSINSTGLTTGSALYLANNNANNAYLIRAQAGASLSDRLTLDSNGVLTIFDTAATDYIRISHDGTNAHITTNTGNVEIGSGSGDLTLGDALNAVNIHFAYEAAPVSIGGAAGTVINFNQAGNIIPAANNTYDLGAVGTTWANIYGTAIYQGTYQVCDASGNCGANSGEWTLGTGILYTNNQTADVLIGGTSTASAKFAFKNVASGTPTASISGSTNIATFIDGNGNISTTNRQNLVLGNSATYNTTGNILLNPNGTGNVGIGTTNPLEKLHIIGEFISGANVTTDATQKDFAYGVQHYTNTEEPVTLIWGVNPLSENRVAIGGGTASGNAATNIRFYTAANTTTTTGTEQMRIDSSGNVGIGTTTPGAKLEVNGTGLRTIYSNAAISDITLGSATGVDSRMNVIPTAQSYMTYYGVVGVPTLATNQWVNGTINGLYGSARIGSNGTANQLWGGVLNSYITNGYTGNASTSGGLKIESTDIEDGTSAYAYGALIYAPVVDTGSITSTAYGVRLTNSAIGSGSIANSIPLAIDADSRTVTNNKYGMYMGTMSGAAGNYQLYIAGTADSYFAGKIGIGDTTPDHTLDVAGNIGLNAGGYVNFGDTDGSSGYGFRDNSGTIEFKNSAGSWTGIGSGSGSSLWKLANGAVSPFSDTADVLIGNSATTSAKFAFKNVLTGTPTASISGSTANTSLFMDGNGNISTTNMADLTLGGSTTGNVLIKSRGLTALTANGLTITTGGDLILADTHTLQAGGKTGTAYNAFANSADAPVGASAIAAITSDNDLFVGGDFQAGGTIYDSSGNVLAGYWTLNSGNLYPTTLTSMIGIGTASPISRLSVINNPAGGSLTGKAAFLVDQYENQDILTASASGQTKMALTYDGTLKLYDSASSISNTSGDITIDAASNFISFAGDTLGNIGGLDVAGNATISGMLGIGTTTPTQALDVNGYIRGQRFEDTSSSLFYIDPANAALALNIAGTASTSANLSFNGASTAHLINVLDGGTLNIQRSAVGDVGLTSSMFIDTSGNVGIGTTSPGGRLDVSGGFLVIDNGDLGTPRGIRFRETTDTTTPTGGAIYQANNNNLYIQAGSANYINLRDASGANQFNFNTSNSVIGFQTAGGGLKPSAANSTTAIQIKDYGDNVFVNFDSTNQRVGIGTVAPAVALDINGYARAQRFEDTTSPTSFYIDPAASGTSVSIEGNIVSNGAFSITSNATNGDITINAGSGNVIIGDGATSKLDAGTIDPPYTINGNKYATYVASMTGVKEETTGTVTTSEPVSGQGYRASLDFAGATDGSDLWIFSNVTNLPTNLDKLVVLLSPSSNTKAWYTFDASGKIYIYTSHPTSVSYRLTAPRFDSDNWANTRDSGVAGFVIPDNNIWPGSSNPTGGNQLSFDNLSVSVSTESGEVKYNVIDNLTSTVIEDITALSHAVIANIKAGAIVTKDLATTSFTAFQGTVDNMLVSSGLVAGRIQTKLISPLADETDVTIQVGSASESGKLAIQNGQGSEVASIDSNGNATFSGTVNSEQLTVVTDATVSGTLFADNIKSKSLDDIQDLLAQVQTDQNLLAQASTWSINATNSANLDEIATADLYVTNQAAINSLSVTNALTVGTDMILQSSINSELGMVSSMDTLTSPLRIQSLAMAPVEIMAGLIKIDTLGNVQIAGNLAVGGHIEGAGLTLQDRDITATVSGSLLTFQDSTGMDVASVNSSGSASFANISTQGLTIAGATDATNSAVINGVITTNATAGSGVIASDRDEITIKNPNVTDYSLVYVTPTSSTENYVLYVKSKAPGEFVVGFTNPIGIDVNFNWWIVQIKN